MKKTKKLQSKITSNKTKHVVIQNELKKYINMTQIF